MFTGIVEDSGIVKRIIKKSDSVEIVIESKIISVRVPRMVIHTIDQSIIFACFLTI